MADTADEIRQLKRHLEIAARHHGIAIPRGFDWRDAEVGGPARELIRRVDDKLLHYHPGDPGRGTFDQKLRDFLMPLPPPTPKRDRIVEHAVWAAAHEASIHYRQARPMDALHSPRVLPWYTDCSEFVTTIYCWSGAPDPNGRGYDGLGNTATLLGHCRRINRSDLRPGDIIVWGWGGGDHTAVVIGTGRNPMLVSHGSERGPLRVTLDDETAVQQSLHGRHTPVTFLRCPGLA